MNKGKMTVFAVMAAVLLTTAIFIVFLMTTAAGNRGPEISLPPAPSDDVTSGNNSTVAPEVSAVDVEYLDITPENVQSIIEYLNRPDNYSLELQIEYHWSGGSSILKRRTWVLNDAVRWQHFDRFGNPVLNYISTPGTVYVWEEYGNGYVNYPEGDFTPDDFGQIPTYEDILEAEKGDIISASYEDRQSVPCVMVEIVDRDSGYTHLFWVSLDNGLLWEAEILVDDQLIYRMSVIQSSFSVKEPELSDFQMPGGKNPIVQSQLPNNEQ
jgi:hypothetical protein